MGMIYLGNSTYVDSDDMDDAVYAEFCKHRDNLRRYYEFKDNDSAISKGKIIGVDIPKLIAEAEDFIAIYFLDYDADWRFWNGEKDSKVDKIAYIIANNVEE